MNTTEKLYAIIGYLTASVGGLVVMSGPIILSVMSDNYFAYGLSIVYFIWIICAIFFYLKERNSAKNFVLFFGSFISSTNFFLILSFLVLYFLQPPAFWIVRNFNLSLLLYTLILFIFLTFFYLRHKSTDWKKYSNYWRSQFFLVRHENHGIFKKDIVYFKDQPTKSQEFYKGEVATFWKYMYRAAYILLVLVCLPLLLLGGGSGLVILEVLEPTAQATDQSSPHHLIIYLISLPLFAFLGDQMPLIFRSYILWKNLRTDITSNSERDDLVVFKRGQWNK